VGFILEHPRPSEEDFRKQESQIRTAILNERRQTRFTDWMLELRKKAKIEDFRENYFEA